MMEYYTGIKMNELQLQIMAVSCDYNWKKKSETKQNTL